MMSITSQTKLTAAQRKVLRQLKDSEYPDNEIVCAGRECWISNRRTSWRLVNALLCMTAISDESDQGGGARRFTINETGEHILADESNIQKVATALLKGGAWSWKSGKLIRI